MIATEALIERDPQVAIMKVKTIFIKGVKKTDDFSDRKTVAAFNNAIPVFILSLKQKTIKP